MPRFPTSSLSDRELSAAPQSQSQSGSCSTMFPRTLLFAALLVIAFSANDVNGHRMPKRETEGVAQQPSNMDKLNQFFTSMKDKFHETFGNLDQADVVKQASAKLQELGQNLGLEDVGKKLGEQIQGAMKGAASA